MLICLVLSENERTVAQVILYRVKILIVGPVGENCVYVLAVRCYLVVVLQVPGGSSL